MRHVILIILAGCSLLVSSCGSQEQAPTQPAKPSQPANVAPAQPPATPPAVAPQEAPKPATPAVTEIAKPPAAPVAAKPAPAPGELQPVAPVPAPPAAAKPAEAVKPVSVVDKITLEASQGKVTLTHLAHAKTFPCEICHGDGIPAKIGLTKETAHALCRDCHKAKGAGPTACGGCHQK